MPHCIRLVSEVSFALVFASNLCTIITITISAGELHRKLIINGDKKKELCLDRGSINRNRLWT